MSKGSETTTEGIRIKVIPQYLPSESKTENSNYLFAYTITIYNESDIAIKLISRHWIIINADGEREDVEGEGVVGYQPELNPGNSFTYTSYCPLDTEWGTMEGTYKMVRDDGSSFYAKIGRFYLSSIDN